MCRDSWRLLTSRRNALPALVPIDEADLELELLSDTLTSSAQVRCSFALRCPFLTVTIRGIVRLGVDFADLVDVVRPGLVLHLRDGAIGIRIDKVTRSCAEGVVLNSGSIGERKVVQIDSISMHNRLSSESRT